MALTQSFGEPWVHEGISCVSCQASPITGYCYKSQTPPYDNFCSKCYRQQELICSTRQQFLKVGRAAKCRPFQIHCIECDGCGISPLRGPRYHHKVRSDVNLCATCFVDATRTSNPEAEASTMFEMVEYTEVTSVCKTHHPVFHFNSRCAECQVSPVCGPVYSSIANSSYDLCLICFDEMLTKGQIDPSHFHRNARPSVHSVVHVMIYSCNHCGVTPICGPAFVSQKRRSKIVCLLCYLNMARDKQGTYTRLEPPLQLDGPVQPGAPLDKQENRGASQGEYVEAQPQRNDITRPVEAGALDLAAQNHINQMKQLQEEQLRNALEVQKMNQMLWLSQQQAAMVANAGWSMSRLI